MHLTAAAITLGSLAMASAMSFGPKSAVQVLGAKNFKRTVQGSEKLTVVAFVAPWCGHCQKLAPEYDRAAENLRGLVNIAAVDCDEDENKNFCGEQGIKGFPTLKYFGGGSSPARDYEGPRTAKGLIEFATKNMPTFVKKVSTASELETLRSKSMKKPITLLFTSATLVTPLYKALSTDFHKKIDFYAARDTKVGAEAMKAFGVEKVPAIVVIHENTIEKYEGPVKYAALVQFLQLYSGPVKPKQSSRDEL